MKTYYAPKITIKELPLTPIMAGSPPPPEPEDPDWYIEVGNPATNKDDLDI